LGKWCKSLRTESNIEKPDFPSAAKGNSTLHLLQKKKTKSVTIPSSPLEKVEFQAPGRGKAG
jgi:hypothetical protein